NVGAFVQQDTAFSATERLGDYLLPICPALFVGIVIAAPVRALVSPLLVVRFLGELVLTDRITGPLGGARFVLGSDCVGPVVPTVAETSGRLAPAIGLMLASPSLNPAALTLTFMLFEPRIAVLRVLLAIGAVLIIGPVAERAGGRRQSCAVVPNEPSEH